MSEPKKFSKRIVIFAISMIVLYTIVAIVYQFTSGNELSSTLTGCWYGFFGGELLATAGIKISEVIKGEQ